MVKVGSFIAVASNCVVQFGSQNKTSHATWSLARLFRVRRISDSRVLTYEDCANETLLTLLSLNAHEYGTFSRSSKRGDLKNLQTVLRGFTTHLGLENPVWWTSFQWSIMMMEVHRYYYDNSAYVPPST